MKCQTCGVELEPGMVFCPNCGARAADSETAPQTERLRESSDDVDAPAALLAESSGSGARMYSAPDIVAPPVRARPVTQPLGEDVPQWGNGSLAAITSTYSAPSSSYAGAAPVVLPNSTTATVSLIFGILSYIALPVVGPIVAVIAGHMAKNEIRRSNGQLGGSGMATAGLVLGYIQIVLLVLGLCAVVGFILLAALSSAGQ